MTDRPKTTSRALLYKDFDTTWYKEWSQKLKQDNKHRGNFALKANKFWQNAAIAQALKERGVLKEGARGLGFGVGEERLPALFASLGVSITATDQNFTKEKAKSWDNGQLAHSKDSLNELGICPADKFEKNVVFQANDMNNISASLKKGEYDFIWSNCALGHLGSINKSTKFIEESLACLKPGGWAVHTTEVNILSDTDTLDNADTVFFRQRDLKQLFLHLTSKGFIVEPLKLKLRNDHRDDRFTLSPEWGNDHSKILFDGYMATQVILIIHKPNKPTSNSRRLAQKLRLRAQYSRNIGNINRLRNRNATMSKLLSSHTVFQKLKAVDTAVAPDKKVVKIKLKARASKTINIRYTNNSNGGLFRIYHCLNDTNPVSLATANPANHASKFAHSDWRAKDRPDFKFVDTASLKDELEYVQPSQDFAVSFNITAPAKTGTYTDEICLIKEFDGIIPYTEVALNITVEA